MPLIDVLYEDNHIVVVNKKVSDIVQGDITGDVTLKDKVAEYLKIKYNKPGNVFVGVVHRLDRPTSGAIVFARTSKALSRLNQQFKTKDSLKKTYWAIVKNKPKADAARLEDYLKKDASKNKSYVKNEFTAGAKQAVLEYKIIEKSDSFYLLEVELITGRHHQIRAQLSNIGCPIKGDLKYGYNRSESNGGICLHARELDFLHPVKKERLKITAPVPNDKLWLFFQNSKT